MKIANTTSTTSFSGSRDAFRRLKALGYDAADYSMFGCAPGEGVYSLMDREFEALILADRQAAVEEGIEIIQTHGVWPYDDRIIAQAEPKFTSTIRGLYGSSLIGAQYMIIHPVMPAGWAKSEHHEADYEQNLRFIERVIPYAKKFGVKLALENMPNIHVPCGSTSELISTLDTLNSEWVVACFDTGHSNAVGEKVGDAIRQLGSRLECIHVHDNDGRSDQHRMPYFGTTDWADVTAALKEIGYKGVFNLECNIPRSIPAELRPDMENWLAKTARKLAADCV